MLDRFENEYLRFNNISADRATGHLNVLRAFASHARKDLLEATADDVRAFLGHLIDSGQHPNTVRKKNTMIRVYYQWAFDVDLIDAERLMRILKVPNPNGSSNQGPPRPYSVKDLKRWRAELDERWPIVEPRWWDRYRRGTSRYRRVASEVMRRQIEAVVALALHCGLRRQEIFNLSLDDMHPDNAYVVVRQRARVENGKDRFREVPYTESARTAVRRWLNIRTELDPPHDRPWIVATTMAGVGNELNPMSIRRFGELVATVGEWELHRFRHTSATTWLRAGMDLEVVSRHLGHRKIQQTLGYAELVAEDVQRAVEKNEARFGQLLGEDDAREAGRAAA